jgi:hypothetical protein
MQLNKQMQLLLGSVIILLISTSVYGQAPLEIVPLEANPQIKSYLDKHPQLKNSQVCPSSTISLPFFDDFANNPNGIYPDCNKWQDNHAFVNQNMAYNPPSIGVATLDGLNPSGEPYDQTANPAIPVSADTLTSQIIDLSSFNSSSQLVLSYFYQPMGLADIPEEVDSLVVEFLDTAGNWILVESYLGLSDTTTPNARIDFQQDFISITNAAFLHNNFQFRFRNHASVAGNNDHWHIDYVYLDANRTDTTPPVFYADVAFTHPPVSPFGDYTAIPWNHFNSSLWNNDVEMMTYNHGNVTGTMDRRYLVEDTSGLNLLNSQVPAITYGPSPNPNDLYDAALIGSFNSFNPTEATQLKSTYVIDNPSDFQNNAIYQNNDTCYRYTELSNYYAYDDGTAETRIIAAGIGTQVAVRYETTVDDTLRGIYFHLPYFRNRDSEQDFVNVKVWADSSGTIGSELFSRDIYTLEYSDGFNGFHYVELTDFAGTPTPVALSANTSFYVGWQQASTTEVPVGFDRNANNSDKTFIKIGGNAWINSDLYGTIMIRPLLSLDADPFIIPVEEVELPAKMVDFKVFPNPNNGWVNLQCDACRFDDADYRLELYNSLGQLVLESQWQNQLQFDQLPQGMYVLRLMVEGQALSQKRLIKNR